MFRGSEKELFALSCLRGLNIEGLELAQERGLLRFGHHWNCPAWFITDQTGLAVSARRLDGQKWFNGAKAVMLKGSVASWPIGILEAQPCKNIALVEGGPDLLAAHHLICFEDCDEDWAVVAMLSASVSIHERALSLFRGKRVRIFYHDDPKKQGAKACARWHEQLGISKNAEHFCCGGYPMQGGGISKDLNDQAHASGDWYEDSIAQGLQLVINRGAVFHE